MSTETQRAPEAAPKTEAKKDFNELVNTALADKKLNQQERGEILAVLEQMNSAKEKIKAETVAKLESFLNGANGGSDFEKTKKVLLEKMAANKAITPEPAKVEEPKKEEPKKEEPKAEEPKKEEPAKVEEPKKEEPAKVEEPKKEEPKKPETSMMDKAGNFFTGKLDLNTLPKEDQAAIKDLQDAGFRFKVVEGKKGEYQVDMNGLGDKSKIDLTNKKFTTDTLKSGGKDFTTDFKDTTDAKDKMTKVNTLVDTMAQLSPLEKVYDTHRTFQEQDQYQKLTTQKATLEKDLEIASPAPKAAGAEGGK